MSLDEGEWVDGELASQPMTTSKCVICWQVLVGTTLGAPTWADFKMHEASRMDAALLSKEKGTELTDGENKWLIDFKDMVQINSTTGTRRPIRRTVIVKPVSWKE